jgi:uncharacterized protein (TIGR02246 family)
MTTAHLAALPSSAEAVVQRQLDAYNARNLQAWLNTYAPDAEQHLLHGEPLALGREAIRARMSERFNDPALHARLLHRTVMEQVVVDHECVTRTGPQGLTELEMVCIYEVSGEYIAKATFALGQTRTR